MQSSTLVAVAPNGASLGKGDHIALPITPCELAVVAEQCLEAGAGMIHLHVRDEQGLHSIEPKHYEPAIAAVKQVVGDNMIIQVTSESAGKYDRHQQIQALQSLQPECLTVALRELVPNPEAFGDAAKFLQNMEAGGTLIQYILYDTADLERFYQLMKLGVILKKKNFVILVLGKYGGQQAKVEDLSPFLPMITSDLVWMCCAFGPNEPRIMREVAARGGHLRVGYENNLMLENGERSTSNVELVTASVESVVQAGRSLSSAQKFLELNGF